MNGQTDIRSLTLSEMTALAQSYGEKAFRGKQLYQWIHQKMVADYREISNLPEVFLQNVKESYALPGMRIVRKQISKKRDTAKYLFALSDGNVIESVWMKYDYGNSVCISSQVGCRMGCTFCASTLNGWTRNLTAGEMLSQIYEIQRETGERVSNVIVMGMGEPLDNYDNLIRFVRLLSDEGGLHLSQRSITVSTCGLVRQMRDLMKEKLQITLAVSLHAPNDQIRRKMMPIANQYSVNEILSVCREYVDYTGRRVTFEYSMVDGVNDGKAQAEELAAKCRGLNCHINLISLNEVKETQTTASKEENIKEFKQILERHRVNVTIRREMGSDIDAACGQLRKNYIESEQQSTLS